MSASPDNTKVQLYRSPSTMPPLITSRTPPRSTMNKIASPVPPFASKDDFISIGLWATTLDKPLDCSICREPLTLSNINPAQLPTIESTALYQFPILPCTDSNCAPGYNINTTRNTTRNTTLDSLKESSDDPIPEAPIRIAPCNHVFGSVCLKSWFENSTSNRCPECDTTLFPQRIHLALSRPTPAMRLELARFIEQELDDEGTATLIQENLTSAWASASMREFAVEIHRARGYEGSWEYICDEIEEEDDENLMEDAHQDEEMGSESEYEPDDEEEDDED